MQICFFEDKHFSNFHPLTLTRPVDDLRVGIFTIAEKWQKALQAKNTARILRKELKEVFEEGSINENDSCLWINARYLPSSSLLKEVEELGAGNCLQSEGTVIAARADGSSSRQWLEQGKPDFNSLFVLESADFKAIEHLWDLFKINGSEIKADIQRAKPGRGSKLNISSHAILVEEENIYIATGATLEAGTIINAENGPVYIGEGAHIKAGSIIYGPTAICSKATVNAGAKIYGDTTIGPVCKVGGEVNNAIFHSYSNKGHEGFVGNSVFGQWCNLGADTNTSNLKNNYSTIRITDWKTEQEIETGEQFFGTVMGDHSKTAINTQLNTGTVCGVNCNIFSGDFPPKFIHSFSWVGSNVIQKYRLDKAFETMEAMMARRGVSLTEPYKKMMEAIFQNAR
ncbi:glucose-1-phosphate thymidylyltransferase [Balneolaceae bacterium YR4-1]|uniref:Glucose-1-phosphate thymidylyltransferase n=1 Tax=Halalkalibaculum roseum TaxID=2709311 RepID=A0A6M1SJK2_9BACT|nr:putative sugar nucleotidyl transferase [Halalkalibaculum roseum]NGP75481.1 glucose-1-phosphate thymidylyltransferase [Halalkalibaculum roseum]